MDNDVELVGKPETSAMAITSLVLGVVSFLCSLLVSIPAIILGAIALAQINKSEGQLGGSGLAIAGIVTGGVSAVLHGLLMVAMLLPAIQAAREAARRNVTMSHMKQVSLGILNYESAMGSFPASGNADAADGTQLSWRVRILPFLGYEDLYRQFHLDEPWDSEHNRSLIPQMPEIFSCVSADLAEGETVLLAVTGPGTLFGDGTRQRKMRDVHDGLSNTIYVVEADADRAVIWTKPEDLTINAQDPLSGLGNLRPFGFLAGYCDGHIDFIKANQSPESVHGLMTHAGGEDVNRW